MDRKQEARLNMFDAVTSFCTTNATSVASVAAFQTAFTSFQTVVAQIHDTAQMEAAIISGIAADKSQLRLALCEQAISLSAALYAFASAANNNQLKNQASVSPTEFKRFNDERLVPTCANVYDALNANIAGLAPYGITAAMVTNFQNAMDVYQAKIASPRNAVSMRSAHLATLDTLFKLANAILKDQMDKMALQVKTTDGAFYVAYKSNRSIVDPGSSATQITGTITNSVTQSPLRGATVEVVGQLLTTVTDENGFYVLRSVRLGNNSVKVAIAGYEDKQEDDLRVKLGQTTNADIAMTPKVS
jgi:hypothetical protein